jgi:uncharacterized membrane protein YfcA
MPDLDPARVALLAAVAFAAGAIDAIAGGGGLLTVPALLAAGLPPHLAVATNKGQSTFGTLAALVRFARGGLVGLDRARVMFPLGAAGSLAGAALVLATPPAALRGIVVGLLAFAAVFVGFRRGPPPRLEDAPPRRAGTAVAAAIALVIGAYDGFFGPGTGCWP